MLGGVTSADGKAQALKESQPDTGKDGFFIGSPLKGWDGADEGSKAPTPRIHKGAPKSRPAPSLPSNDDLRRRFVHALPKRRQPLRHRFVTCPVICNCSSFSAGSDFTASLPCLAKARRRRRCPIAHPCAIAMARWLRLWERARAQRRRRSGQIGSGAL